MIKHESLNAIVARVARETPHRILLAEVDGESFSYADVDANGRRWAGLFGTLGASAGDSIAVMGHPCADWVQAWLGASWIGARAVGVNTQYVGDMLFYLLDQSNAKILVVDAGLLAELNESGQKWPVCLEEIVLIGRHDLAEGPVAGISTRPCELLLAMSDAPTDLKTPSNADICGVTYTSGTTGRSKGVLMTWQQLSRLTLDGLPWDDLGDDVVFYVPFPMYHVAGLVGVYVAAVNGGSAILRKTWSTSDYWRDIRQYQCTVTFFVGGTSEFIIGLPERDDDADHSLRNILMTPLPKDLATFERRFGFKVWTFYATTEIGTVLASEISPGVPGTCGQLRHGVQLRLVDEAGQDVADGEAGEAWVRTEDQLNMLQGYLNNPEAWDKAWTDGWFRTGDLLKRDGLGNYFFVDRARDYIRRRGENISSREVEMEVNAHPAVLESAAIGVPSATAENEVMVYIELQPNASLSEDELRSFLKSKMPKFMQPAFIKITDGLPRTPTGKVVKAELRKQAAAAKISG